LKLCNKLFFSLVGEFGIFRLMFEAAKMFWE
jgi:hypothetical protein